MQKTLPVELSHDLGGGAARRDRQPAAPVTAKDVIAKAQARAERAKRLRRLRRKCLREGIKSAAESYTDALFDSTAAESVPMPGTGQREDAIEGCLKAMLGPLGDVWDAVSTLLGGDA